MENSVTRIEKNVFRITEVGEKKTYGSAFAVAEDALVSSYHVVDPEGDGNPAGPVVAFDVSGHRYEGTIVEINKNADLSRILFESELRVERPFDSLEDPPPIGTMCLWGGFPLFIGEHSPRLRFAQGMVSSQTYECQDGVLFEIDGMFSPGHSGSPVVSTSSGELVGVVMSSAGQLIEILREAKITMSAMAVIQSSWQEYTEMAEALETIVEEYNGIITEIDDRISTLCSLLPEDCRPDWGEIETPILHYPDYLSIRLPEAIPETVESKLEERNIVFSEHETNLLGMKVYHIFLRGRKEAAMKAIVDFMMEWTKLMGDALDQSFQMGMGIASCDGPLRDLIH